ncbi:MAG TPA: response regulator, partial [Kofleriaceae bacterium]|nr:response regulator [Kofleriaceae bacterium]
MVQLVLTKGGYQVQTAVDGEAGLESVRAQRPDLILLDFVMPRMNGYQFCRELVADPKLRDIPVVLMSAKGDQVGERFVKVMGIVDYITKPFSPEAITAVVQHTIGKYATGDRDDDNPSLVTGEDLAATDDADRAHARSAALGALRVQITDVVSARVAALFQLVTAAARPAPRVGDRSVADSGPLANDGASRDSDSSITPDAAA